MEKQSYVPGGLRTYVDGGYPLVLTVLFFLDYQNVSWIMFDIVRVVTHSDLAKVSLY